MDEMVLDLQVFVEKLGWPRIIRMDSADLRGRDEDIFGLLLRIKAFHRRSVQKIQFSARFADKPLEPLALQFPPDRTADQTAMAGHVNPRVLRHWHGDSLGWILHTFQGCLGVPAQKQAAAAPSLSMNRPFGVPALAGPNRLKAGLQTSGVPPGQVHGPNAFEKTKGGSP